MDALKAETAISKLRQAFPSMTFSRRYNLDDVQIVGIAKTLEVGASGLQQLGKIVKDATVSFGRSGANFRMTIS